MIRRAAGAAMLALSACVPGPVAAGTVGIPVADTVLRAEYAVPAAPGGAGVVALHGCGGPFPSRDRQWRDRLTGAGHPVLFPDSFGSRGLGSQCRVASRGISPAGRRRSDAVAAAGWLAAQPGVPAGGVVVMGWSNGGSTVLNAAGPGVMPPGLVRGFVAFYPGCSAILKREGWAPSAPLLIVMGAADDWTPAEPCRTLAARHPGRISLLLYPGAYHDFDAPDAPLQVRTGLAYTANGDGRAHAGTDPAARADALSAVPAWIAALPPAPP